MTLDDFLTLNEVNNGLMALSRVRDLVTVMQNEKNYFLNNSADSTRHNKSAVTRAIAATENKECLDLFIQLDGLQFISDWLKDAEIVSNGTPDTSLEEFIVHLLRALERLHIDYEKLVAYDILTIVENLLVHNNPKVHDKARLLLDIWKTKKIIDASISDSTDIIRDRESSPKLASIPRDTSVKNNRHELSRDNQVVSTCSDAVRPDRVESSNEILDPPTLDERPLDQASPDNSRREIQDDARSNLHDSKYKTLEGRPITPSSDDVAETKDVTGPSSQKNSNSGNENPREEGSDSDEKSAGDDVSDANLCGNSDAFIAKDEDGDVNRRILPKSISSEKSWGKFLSGIRDNLSDDDRANNYGFGEKQTDRESVKKTHVDVDFGIVDPLEVAMQVAMEVEREIVDYGEHIHSPSEKLPESNTPQPESPDGKEFDSSEGSPMEAASDSNSKSSEQSETSSANLDANRMQDDVATSRVAEAARDEPLIEKSPCNSFDLNEEFFSDDLSRPGNQYSAPVSVVSASRATAVAHKLPGAPLQFEGNLGWRGSASTSAFRPASAFRMPEINLSVDSNSKLRQEGCCLDFDLNVSDSVDESSVETNSKRSEHLELDLNCASEDGGALLDWRIGNFGNWSRSLSIEPIRIDLNDQPSFLNVNPKSDDSAVSIMGTRVEFDRKDFSSSQKSRTSELAFDFNLGRTGNFIGIGSTNPNSHSSVYDYGDIGRDIGPGPVVPFSGPIYGPGHIPYMVDSRGAPIVPQIMCSGSGLPTAFSQPPFVINMIGSTASDGVGPSRSGFDLNSGISVENGSKDLAGHGLLSNPAQFRPVDGPIFQAAVGEKRKEPDNGYNNDNYYPFKYYYTPLWKQS